MERDENDIFISVPLSQRVVVATETFCFHGSRAKNAMAAQRHFSGQSHSAALQRTGPLHPSHPAILLQLHLQHLMQGCCAWEKGTG